MLVYVVVDNAQLQVFLDQRHCQRAQLHPRLGAAVPWKSQVLQLRRWRQVSTLLHCKAAKAKAISKTEDETGLIPNWSNCQVLHKCCCFSNKKYRSKLLFPFLATLATRFVLKLTDFGLHELRRKSELDSDRGSYEQLKARLWTAPELLRQQVLLLVLMIFNWSPTHSTGPQTLVFGPRLNSFDNRFPIISNWSNWSDITSPLL